MSKCLRRMFLNLADKLKKISSVYIFLIIILILCSGIIVIGQSIFKISIVSNGSIITSEDNFLVVYSDQTYPKNVYFINWGIIDAGQTITKNIYIKNSGDTNCVLSLSTSDWIPQSATDYISLNWDWEGYILQPQETILAVLTLDVKSEIINVSTFDFKIIITGIT